MDVPRRIGEPLRVAVAAGLRVRFAEATVQTYVWHLGRFFAWLLARGVEDVGRVRAEDVEAYRTDLAERTTERGRPASTTHLNTALAAVKALYRWLSECDVIGHDPARRLRPARLPRRLPHRVLSIEEAVRLVEAPPATTALGLRDRAALELLYGAGLRRAELLALDLGDADAGDQVVRVELGKGGKGRIVPFGAVAARAIETYERWARPELALRGPRERALFVSFRGRRLDRQTLADVVLGAARAAGIDRHVTPHSLRHACATHMTENGAELRHLQEILGHASLDSTQVYTHLSLRHLRETYARCHPRERTEKGSETASPRPDLDPGG